MIKKEHNILWVLSFFGLKNIGHRL
jgi:hypothetical protein